MLFHIVFGFIEIKYQLISSSLLLKSTDSSVKMSPDI